MNMKDLELLENLNLQSGCHDLGYGNGCHEKAFQTLVCEKNKNCGGITKIARKIRIVLDDTKKS